MVNQQQQYESGNRKQPRGVFYTGADALDEGVGLCYDSDRGTATAADGTRMNYVEKPASGNNRLFAGVTAQAYTAKTGGQFITIYEPGSVCRIAVGADTTVNATLLTCSAGTGGVGNGDQGRFARQGFMGRGTALCLRTTTGILERNDDASAALDATGLILTDGAATFVTNGVAAGDRVYIYQGERDGTNVCTPNQYEVASVTSETVLVLTAVAADGGDMDCSYYVMSGNAMCEAYLYDGEESGLVEVLSPINSAALTNTQSMVGGMTYIGGGVTLAANDGTSTLADGVRNGEKKGFYLLAALTTNGWLLTTTSAIKIAGSGALSSLDFNSAGDYAMLEWYFDEWHSMANGGATEA